MLIDINTYIGHWPFRQIRNNNAYGLIKLMEQAGVDKAAVSSINSVFYKDTQEGNQELIDEIEPYKERFIPFAIINPSYTGWKKDFLYCIDQLDMKGLELYPYYHQYELTSANAVELLKLAGEKKVPVHLPCSIVNLRQRHRLDTSENLSVDQVEKVLTLCPDTDFIITNGPTHTIASQLKKATGERNGKVYYDFSKVEVFLPRGGGMPSAFQSLIQTTGIDRIVFASVMPFQYIDPQFVRLEFTQINDDDKEKIMSGNLKALFNLE